MLNSFFSQYFNTNLFSVFQYKPAPPLTLNVFLKLGRCQMWSQSLNQLTTRVLLITGQFLSWANCWNDTCTVKLLNILKLTILCIKFSMGISVRKVNSHCAAVTTPKWFQLMDDAGKEIRVVLLDLRKVFDSVQHQALLDTELNEFILKWICDYLIQRKRSN